jgi:hypothetical protein
MVEAEALVLAGAAGGGAKRSKSDAGYLTARDPQESTFSNESIEWLMI